MILFNLFLFQAQQAPSRGGNLFTALVPFILVFLIFYFLIIWPARKRQKKHREMVEQLQPGDKVITSGGIYGTVMGVKEDRIELKISSNVKIEIAKSAIAAILTPKARK